jgi:hypothetical protein
MIKRLILPNPPAPSQGLIDAMRRLAFDSPSDLGNRNRAVVIHQCHAEQVNMVRHNDSSIERIFPAIGPKTRLQRQVHRDFRQPPSMPGRVGNKQNPIVLLIVRQIPPVLILPLHNERRLAPGKASAGVRDLTEHFRGSRLGIAVVVEGRDADHVEAGDSPAS